VTHPLGAQGLFEIAAEFELWIIGGVEILASCLWEVEWKLPVPDAPSEGVGIQALILERKGFEITWGDPRENSVQSNSVHSLLGMFLSGKLISLADLRLEGKINRRSI
jgi:hypothetical protein